MRVNFKRVLCISVSACAVFPGGQALAQEAVLVDESEIVVTAQKRQQRLIDVPVAVSSIDADGLATQNTARLADIYEKLPGIQYSGQRVAAISLRGITAGGTGNPTIAILVDDVQFGGTTSAGQTPLPDFDPSALDRIEVLRGPQGTLYGAASLGGLIKYVLRAPSTDRLSGRVEVGGTAVSHGDYGYSARGSLNVPLADWLAVTASGFYREDAPYLNNASTNPLVTKRVDVNTRKAWGFRGAALARPTSNLTLSFSGLYQKQDANNADLAITSGGVPICTVCYNGTPAGAAAPVTFEPVFGDLTLNAVDSFNTAKFQLYTGRAELDLGGAQITSISAWSRADNIISNDVTAPFTFLRGIYNAPGGAVQIGNSDYTHKFSQEVRISGNGEMFDWLVGGFYTIEHAGTDQTLFVTNAAGANVISPFASLNPSAYREYAGFGDLTWHVTDKFDLQVGGRYAHNKQKSVNEVSLDSRVVGVLGMPGVTLFDASDNVFTWLVTPSYQITPDMMIYARAASGYRPGGANAPSTGAPAYSPDTVINYEIGFKGKVIPDVLTLDAAVFQIDWKKIQLPGLAANNFAYVTNGGKARSRGVELQASLIPWIGMKVDGNMAITDAVVTQSLPFLNPSSLAASAGDRLPFSAKFTGNVSAQQTFAMKDRVEATIGATFTYVGGRPAPFNTVAGNTTGHPRFTIPSYSTVGVNAGVTFDEVWSINAYVRNLLDSRGIATAQSRSGANVPTALFIQPMTMGITLARKF